MYGIEIFFQTLRENSGSWKLLEYPWNCIYKIQHEPCQADFELASIFRDFESSQNYTSRRRVKFENFQFPILIIRSAVGVRALLKGALRALFTSRTIEHLKDF